MMVLGLRQAGVRWWIIFSISGYSALMVFLLTSLYLFAIFRGVGRSGKTELEHPLTSSVYYSIFYDITPFLGALAGGFGVVGISGGAGPLVMMAFGSLWATFSVWIAIDPCITLLENCLPASRAFRKERLTQEKLLKQRRMLERQNLLAQIEVSEQQETARFGTVLEPYAGRLAELVCDSGQGGTEIVDIGLKAWQTGGIRAMRMLHLRTLEILGHDHPSRPMIDSISICWDGIGTWRLPPFDKEIPVLNRVN